MVVYKYVAETIGQTKGSYWMRFGSIRIQFYDFCCRTHMWGVGFAMLCWFAQVDGAPPNIAPSFALATRHEVAQVL